MVSRGAYVSRRGVKNEEEKKKHCHVLVNSVAEAPKNRKQCPEVNPVTCSNCNKIYHFAKVCNRKNKQPEMITNVGHTVDSMKTPSD